MRTVFWYVHSGPGLVLSGAVQRLMAPLTGLTEALPLLAGAWPTLDTPSTILTGTLFPLDLAMPSFAHRVSSPETALLPLITRW